GFLAQYRPDQVVPVGEFADGAAERQRRLGVKLAEAADWQSEPGPVERVVVCPAQPRRLLLFAAYLAGAARARLLVAREPDKGDDIGQRLASWKTREIIAVGAAAKLVHAATGVKL